MGDLIQIAADIAQQGIHFSDMRVVYFRSFSVERQICFSSWKDDIFLLKCIVRHHSNKIVRDEFWYVCSLKSSNSFFSIKKSTKKLSNQFGYDSYGTWFFVGLDRCICKLF